MLRYKADQGTQSPYAFNGTFVHQTSEGELIQVLNLAMQEAQGLYCQAQEVLEMSEKNDLVYYQTNTHFLVIVP